MDTELFSLKDVAQMLRCKPYRITYAISANHGLEPRLRVAGKRIFTLADIHRISEQIDAQLTVMEEA